MKWDVMRLSWDPVNKTRDIVRIPRTARDMVNIPRSPEDELGHDEEELNVVRMI